MRKLLPALIAPLLLSATVASVTTVICIGVEVAAAQPPTPPAPLADVLVLGVFHFKDAGLDGYKPQYDVDIMSVSRQSEIREIVRCLSDYHPTKIAVEAHADRAEKLKSEYDSYLADKFDLPANEIYQLGFRLARGNGHDRVYPVDAKARWYQPFVNPWEYAVEHGQDTLLDSVEAPWEEFYESLYEYEDRQKAQQSLIETFLQINVPDRLAVGHGHYLIGTFKAGFGDEYPGADAKTGWYNRNLRIFANLTRLTEGPGERLLLIIGAGHVPIIRHAIEASPQYRLVELDQFLGQNCADGEGSGN